MQSKETVKTIRLRKKSSKLYVDPVLTRAMEKMVVKSIVKEQRNGGLKS